MAVRRVAASARCESHPASTQAAPQRRAVLAGLGLVPLLSLSTPRASAALETFSDDLDHFQLAIPSGWVRAEGVASGAVGDRRVLVFHPVGALDLQCTLVALTLVLPALGDLETNINIVTTNASNEMTKLGSMGSAYEFGFRMVVSQDRRGRKTNAQIADLLNTSELGDAYLVEYTIQRPDDNISRHLHSLVTLRFDGMYNRLFTVTGQYRESDAARLGAEVAAAVASFKLTPLPARA